MNVHKNIKQYRITKNWTQEDLASRLNVARQTVSKWEQGINEPDISTLKKLSEVFEVSVDVLLGKETQEKKDNFSIIVKTLNIVSISLCIFISLMLIILTRYLYDKIPMHYNGAGMVDRYGSKWEWLLMLAYFISILGTDLFCSHFVFRDLESKSNRRAFVFSKCILWLCQMVGIGIFCGFALQFLKKGYLFSIINCGCYAFLFSILWIVHPAIIKPNRFFGVRTTLTLSNEVAWNRVNRFACYALSINCMVIIILQLFINEFWYSFFFSFLIFFGLGMVLIYYVIVKQKLK